MVGGSCIGPIQCISNSVQCTNDMEFREPTSEQRERFEAEFKEYWDRLPHGPHYHIGDRTDLENIWCRTRAYSEPLLPILYSPTI